MTISQPSRAAIARAIALPIPSISRIGDPVQLADGREGWVQSRTIAARGTTFSLESYAVRTIGGVVVVAKPAKVTKLDRAPKPVQDRAPQ